MLNEAIKQIRLFHQIKQSELAEMLGLSKSYLSELESNKKPISLEILDKYAQIFSVPTSSLMIFSESLDAKSRSEKLRLKCASKIIKIMEWLNAGVEEQAERQEKT